MSRPGPSLFRVPRPDPATRPPLGRKILTLDPAVAFPRILLATDTPPINLVEPAVLRVPANRLPTAKRPVVAGIRPEDLEIGAGPVPPGAMEGPIYVVEPMGAETWVTLEAGGRGGTPLAAGRAPADFVGRSGEPAWARYDPSRLHFFDAESSSRVESGAS